MDAKQYLSGVYLDNHIFSKNETIKMMEEYRNYKIKIMKTKAELLMKSLKRDMFTSEETKLLIEISQLEEKLSVYSLNFINLKAKLDGKVKEFKQLFALKENDWLDFYDEAIKKQLIDNFNLGWKGNVKARYHSEKLDNKYRTRNENEPLFRAQQETYNYYKERLETLND